MIAGQQSSRGRVTRMITCDVDVRPARVTDVMEVDDNYDLRDGYNDVGTSFSAELIGYDGRARWFDLSLRVIDVVCSDPVFDVDATSNIVLMWQRLDDRVVYGRLFTVCRVRVPSSVEFSTVSIYDLDQSRTLRWTYDEMVELGRTS